MVPKGAKFTVIPDDHDGFTMDADKHSEMSALFDVHGWEPCEITDNLCMGFVMNNDFDWRWICFVAEKENDNRGGKVNKREVEDEDG
ncbi:hypothetical protein Tco_0983368 [Tanacetum coccineum]